MKYILIFLITIYCKMAYSATELHKITAQEAPAIEQKIPQPEILKAEFRQTKKISGIEKELVSSGKLIYARQNGLYFEFQKPFAVTYIFTKKGLMQIEDGKQEIMLASKQPFFNEFSQILSSVFSGKYAELSRHFEVSYGENGKEWQLLLKPTNSSVNNVISEITASGNKYPGTLTIVERNGNVTKIKLSGQNSSNLTKDEENYFNF